jgi:hypothetical protein
MNKYKRYPNSGVIYMPLQIRRGTTAERLTITPLPGELIYDTTTEEIFVGDGVQAGGRITTGVSIEDASDAAAALFTSGVHTGIVFDFNDTNNQINASVSFNTLLENLNLNEFDIVGTGNINIDGQITANVNGSIFADDSILLVDAVSGQLVGPLATSGLASNLDLNGFTITDGLDQDVKINALGTGNVVLQSNLNVNSNGNIRKTGILNISTSDLVAIGDNGELIDGNLYITRNSHSNSFGQGFTFAQHHDTADAVNFAFYRTRGTGAVPLSLQDGDDLADIVFAGHNGSSIVGGASISVIVEGPLLSGQIPTKFSFGTNSGTNSAIRAELSSQGVWKVNTIQGLTDTLSIAGNLSGDVKGSVYADDSTRILDGTSGRITAPSATLFEFLKLPVYADDTARDSAIPSPEKGMVIFIEVGTLPAATDQMQLHNGTNWVSL